MVILLRRYVTISVLREVKELLSKEKGDRDWSSFLLELYIEAKRGRVREAFNELRSILSPDELENITRTSEEFRERFKLR